MDRSDEVARLVELWEAHRPVLVFTGAGMSTASGIPDFRGKQGLWKGMDPAKVVSIEVFEENPREFYAFYRQRLAMIRSVQPNEGHRIVAELEEKGYVSAVITQNIDDLHGRAGSRRVFEVHGSVRSATCRRCGRRITGDELVEGIDSSPDGVPRCPCGGVFKVDVVLFGEPLPQDVWEGALAEAERASMAVVLGSSLVVYPAAYIPRIVKNRGGKLAIVNADPTPLDSMADVTIRADLVEVLREVRKGLLGADG